MLRLCVTADDYGMHTTVNRAIEELAARGRISAVAIMVHQGAVLDGLERLKATGVALGLHWVCTQEARLLSSLHETPLAPNGLLATTPLALVRTLASSRKARAGLTYELRAQARRYNSLGLPMDFINSHEHVHELPLLWQHMATVVEPLAPSALRQARRQPITWSLQGGVAALSRASHRLRPLTTNPKILSPVGVGHAGKMTLTMIDDLLAKSQEWPHSAAVIPELVVHPALDDAPLHERYGPKVGKRQTEHRLLNSESLQDLWQRRNVVRVPR